MQYLDEQGQNVIWCHQVLWPSGHSRSTPRPPFTGGEQQSTPVGTHIGWRGSICGEDLPVLSFPLGREVWVQARVGTAWIWGLPEARRRRSSHRGRSHVDSDPDATQQAAQGRRRDGVRGKSWKHAPRWHPGLFHTMLFKHLFLPSGHAGCSLIWSPRARLRALKQIPFRSSLSSDFKYQKSKTRQTRAIV